MIQDLSTHKKPDVSKHYDTIFIHRNPDVTKHYDTEKFIHTQNLM